MKRYGYLMDKVADLNNLRLAFAKAQKGKTGKLEVRQFRQHLGVELFSLHRKLSIGEVTLGDYHYFTIYDPKKRQICAASFRERVIHHALMQVCHPYFEQKQIYHSYATRKNKGTFKALAKAETYAKKYSWFLKMDFRKYFDSIDHLVLKKQLFRLFKDERLLKVLYQIIDSYHIDSGVGLPIGNLTSQYFANHYLAGLDHYCLERLHTPAYLRYMDDVLVFHDDQQTLRRIKDAFIEVAKSNLQLEVKPPILNRTRHGFSFLGFLIFPNKTLLNRRSRKRYIRKIQENYMEMEQGLCLPGAFQQKMLAMTAFTEHAQALAFRQKIIGQYEANGQVSQER